MGIDPKLIFSAVKKHAPTILSGMAIVGVGLTGWLTHEATLKSDPEKSLKENWKNYISPAVAAVGTIACIIGAHKIYLSREAAALAAVAFYKASGEDFEEAVFDKFGNSGLKANVMNADKNDVPKSMTTKIRIWEPYTKQWFEATQQEILWAELTANKMLHQRGQVTLNDVLKLYSDPNLKMKKKGNDLGWSWDDEMFNESACYYYAGGWIDICPQFEEYNGSMRFVMDYGINPNDISECSVLNPYG